MAGGAGDLIRLAFGQPPSGGLPARSRWNLSTGQIPGRSNPQRGKAFGGGSVAGGADAMYGVPTEAAGSRALRAGLQRPRLHHDAIQFPELLQLPVIGQECVTPGTDGDGELQ